MSGVPCSCISDDLDMFFESIKCTMRKVPPVEIARMKILIGTAVGAKEVVLLDPRSVAENVDPLSY